MLKDVEPDQLAESIRSAYKGNIQLHPDIAAALLSHLVPESVMEEMHTDGGSSLADLTPRELEVLQLITKGMSNKAIATSLTVAEKTVKTHVSSILSKLNVVDRTQAALYAVQAMKMHGM